VAGPGLQATWGSSLARRWLHLTEADIEVERAGAEPGVEVEDWEQDQRGRRDHLPHLLLVHVVKLVVGHLMHGVFHLLLDVGVLGQHPIDALTTVGPAQQVRAPEVLDNGDGSGNNEGSEDAGEEDVDGVGDQPRKQQQPG